MKFLVFIFILSSVSFADDVSNKNNHERLTSKLLLGASLLTNLHMYSVFKDVSSKNLRYSDKDAHFAGGFIIANVSSTLAQALLPKNIKSKKLKAFLIGVALSTFVGITKEIRDSTGRGTVEFEDALATTIGGISGSVVISFADLEKIFN